jgi:hypothetical protein
MLQAVSQTASLTGYGTIFKLSSAGAYVGDFKQTNDCGAAVAVPTQMRALFANAGIRFAIDPRFE